MSNDKKWYNYFVSVDEVSAQADEPIEPGSATPTAVKAIADIAASIQPTAKQQDRMEQKLQTAAPAASTGKTMSFDEIYAAAEITAPTHGYSILKVADMLESPHIKALPTEVKRSSVLVALDAAGVKMQDVVEDAVRRDKALDAFERVQNKQVEDLEAAKLDENRKLQAELDKLTGEYRAKMQANTAFVTQRKETFFSWRVEKQKMEQKIADAVSPFVTDNPITTSSRPTPLPPSGKTGI